MPKKITQVKWTASEIPSGLSFNPSTGTFSGTASEAGEYTVPVTVETNYGTDTKDVYVEVEGTAYPVYAIGSQAATWSDGAEADEYGFYKLDMPDAYKLLQHVGGFGAKTASRKYYCCGIDKLIASNSGAISSVLHRATTPTELETIDGYDIEEVKIAYLYSDTYTGTSRESEKINEQYIMLKRYNVNRLQCDISNVRHYFHSPSSSITKTEWYSSSSGGLNSQTRYKLPDGDLATCCFFDGVYVLEGDGSTYTKIYHNGTSDNPPLYITPGNEIGYRAIKVFNPYFKDVYGLSQGKKALYSYLSGDRLLDNDASKFTAGAIQDAWVYMTKAYVQTEANRLYENNGSGAWTDCGYYEVKKLILPSTSNAFVLTKGGELYHKGSAVSGVTEAHTEFKQIYSARKIHDIAYGVSTLTVTMEV